FQSREGPSKTSARSPIWTSTSRGLSWSPTHCTQSSEALQLRVCTSTWADAGMPGPKRAKAAHAASSPINREPMVSGLHPLLDGLQHAVAVLFHGLHQQRIQQGGQHGNAQVEVHGQHDPGAFGHLLKAPLTFKLLQIAFGHAVGNPQR